MPVSGLVIHAKGGEAAVDRLCRALSARGDFEVGQTADSRISVALETRDEDANRAAWRWLNDLPEVAFVDVVCIYFDESSQAHDSTG